MFFYAQSIGKTTELVSDTMDYSHNWLHEQGIGVTGPCGGALM